MKTVALIQARMSSSRFPGKVLADLSGRPMISFMVERVRRANSVDLAAVITSADPSDDALAATMTERSIPVFRGELDDVLNRYAGAAEAYGADVIVRLTGDCPLIDARVIDEVVEWRAASDSDYCSNVAPPTYADGLDVECFTRAVLKRAQREARKAAEREHVTLWMRSDASGLERANVVALVDSAHLRLTVDYPDDLALVRRIVEHHHGGSDFDQYDILRYLDADRALLGINRHERNEGLKASLGTAEANARQSSGVTK